MRSSRPTGGESVPEDLIGDECKRLLVGMTSGLWKTDDDDDPSDMWSAIETLCKARSPKWSRRALLTNLRHDPPRTVESEQRDVTPRVHLSGRRVIWPRRPHTGRVASKHASKETLGERFALGLHRSCHAGRLQGPCRVRLAELRPPAGSEMCPGRERRRRRSSSSVATDPGSI